MKAISIALLIVVSLSLSPVTISAASPDFSMCDGLSGAEWGVCRAGVAAGCADDSGSASACDQIESTYESVAGSPPPWIEPPVECPCDFSLVPKTADSWPADLDNRIDFSCQVSADGVRFVEVDYLDATVTPHIYTAVLTLPGDGVDYTDFCSAINVDAFVDFAENLTPEEREACTASGIEYGRALKAVFGDLVDDTCTPTL